MSRLTEKNDNHYCLAKPYIDWTNGVQKGWDKLGQLEDIEEDLGCPITVREKAFNKGFYDENGKHYTCEHYVPYLKSMHTRGVSISREKHFKLKDYQKTWWLKEDKSE